jgi:hypothetical protein
VARDRKRQIEARQLEGNPSRAIEAKSDRSVVFSHELRFSAHKSYNLQLRSCPQQIPKRSYRLRCRSVVGCLLTSLSFRQSPLPYLLPSLPPSLCALSFCLLCLPLAAPILLSVSTCHSSLLSLPPASACPPAVSLPALVCLSACLFLACSLSLSLQATTLKVSKSSVLVNSQTC